MRLWVPPQTGSDRCETAVVVNRHIERHQHPRPRASPFRKLFILASKPRDASDREVGDPPDPPRLLARSAAAASGWGGGTDFPGPCY